jgi:hypothetical protein
MSAPRGKGQISRRSLICGRGKVNGERRVVDGKKNPSKLLGKGYLVG